jgi:hypothetical protein
MSVDNRSLDVKNIRVMLKSLKRNSYNSHKHSEELKAKCKSA